MWYAKGMENRTLGCLLGLDVNEALADDIDLVAYGLTRCNKTLVITGVGKSGHVAKLLADTAQALCLDAMYLSPEQILHGAAWRMKQNTTIGISYSGESRELEALSKIAKFYILMTSSEHPTILADLILRVPVVSEPYPAAPIPMASVIMMLQIGYAVLSQYACQEKMTAAEYSENHPAGLLALQTCKVEDWLRLHERPMASGPESTTIASALKIMTDKKTGAFIITGKGNRPTGIFTDGDFRRLFLELPPAAPEERLEERIMSKGPPLTISADQSVADARSLMHEKHVNCLPVVDEFGRLAGMLDIQDVTVR